ncbi:Zinc finger, UBP-type [Corchorus olitorius]|uniref:Zinc finger, UBP-type n=1 Tax=Corchorus olitorius TaxID=93759 RepID=A0A1R3KUV4_9ROSI|nr:Zinc finger, UBP-type [Corchorus olitorius]
MKTKREDGTQEVGRDCPYLDTVNRQVLDFDFKKICSVSHWEFDVYACLVCGKYYRGKREKTPAITHSRQAGHHVFINLETEKVYCLTGGDGYEINDPSLDDIRHVLNPSTLYQSYLHMISFYQSILKARPLLDKNKQWSRALDGSDYLPGIVALNDIQKTDFVNVSPHEFLEAVMKASKKRFQKGVQSEPVQFMSWLLKALHADLRTSEESSSIIHECFQGELEVVKETQSKAISEKKESIGEQNGVLQTKSTVLEKDNSVVETYRMPFLMLELDLPEPLVFRDVMEKKYNPSGQSLA